MRKYRKCTGSQESADIAANGTDEMSLKKNQTKQGLVNYIEEKLQEKVLG